MSIAEPGQRITPLYKTWHQLMSIARGRAPRLRASLISLALAAIVQGLALACLIPLFQALIPRVRWPVALPWLLAMTALMLTSTVIRWWAQGFDYRGDMVRSTYELRSELGAQLRRIPLEVLQDKRAGSVNATLLGNVDETLSYILTIANMMASALFTPVTVALVVLYFDWRMGVILLLVFPLLIPLYRWRRPAYGRGMRMLADAHERVSSDILEYVQGLLELRAACCTGEKAEYLHASFVQLEKIQTIGQQKGAKPNLILATVMELAILLVVFSGALFVVQGSLDIVVLAAMMVIALRFAEPLATFVLYAKVIDMVEAALGKIDAMLGIAPLSQQKPSRVPERFDVAFEGVRFAYASSSNPTLRDLCARLPEHSLTALVGPSGSGKSTVTRLLMRHADPQAGRIVIGGVDIRSIKTSDLLHTVGFVFQENKLFKESILENIRYGKKDASREEVMEALRKAECMDIIEKLPAGIDTVYGTKGTYVSGGEAQRLAIARALLQDAPIIVLDEATAFADAENEYKIKKTFDILLKDKTVIMIAHRLSSVVNADKICVIDEGKIAEEGTHKELLARKGLYASMWDNFQKGIEWKV